MSVSSLRRANSKLSFTSSVRSRNSTNHSFSSDDKFSSSSNSSFESELASLRTDNRSMISIQTQDKPKTPSLNGSNLFIKKPPVVPPRKKIANESMEQEQNKHNSQYNKLLLHDDNSSIFSESTDLNTPNVQVLQSPIIPIEKIIKSEENIKKLQSEYNVSNQIFY